LAPSTSRLAEAGALIAQESNPGGLEAAYFAQLPGNSQWRTRPGAINSRNFAHLANFAAFPHGARAGRWGGAMARFKTTAGTAYDYIPHVDDVGMTVVFGRIGSGKSTWLMYVLAMFDQYLVDRDGIIFFFDKDRGGELLTRAVDGTTLVVLNLLKNDRVSLGHFQHLQDTYVAGTGSCRYPVRNHQCLTGLMICEIEMLDRRQFHPVTIIGVKKTVSQLGYQVFVADVVKNDERKVLEVNAKEPIHLLGVFIVRIANGKSRDVLVACEDA